MAAGVAQDDEANLAAAKAFVSHLIETVDPEEFDEVFGVICSPSHVSFTDKSNLSNSTWPSQCNHGRY